MRNSHMPPSSYTYGHASPHPRENHVYWEGFSSIPLFRNIPVKQQDRIEDPQNLRPTITEDTQIVGPTHLLSWPEHSKLLAAYWDKFQEERQFLKYLLLQITWGAGDYVADWIYAESDDSSVVMVMMRIIGWRAEWGWKWLYVNHQNIPNVIIMRRGQGRVVFIEEGWWRSWGKWWRRWSWQLSVLRGMRICLIWEGWWWYWRWWSRRCMWRWRWILWFSVLRVKVEWGFERDRLLRAPCPHPTQPNVQYFTSKILFFLSQYSWEIMQNAHPIAALHTLYAIL